MGLFSYLRIQVTQRECESERRDTAMLLVQDVNAFDALKLAVTILYHNGWQTRDLEEFRMNISQTDLGSFRGAKELHDQAARGGFAWRIYVNAPPGETT